MMIRKSLLLVVVSAFFLTGCYTQLQHTQSYYRDADEPRTYWSGDEQARASQKDTSYAEGYDDGYVDGYYYRDYETAEWYARYGFLDRWHWRHNYGYPSWGFHSPFYHDYYYGSSISFNFHFGYGYPYHWYRWSRWSPWSPYWYNGYFPYHHSGSYYGGYAQYVGPNKDRESNRVYGRRGIGTNRVDAGETSRNDDGNRARINRNTQTRSTPTVRPRGRSVNTGRGTTVRPRSGNSGSTVRSTGRSSQSGSRGRSTGGSSTGSTDRRSRGNDSNLSSPASADNTDATDNVRRRGVAIPTSNGDNGNTLNRSQVYEKLQNRRAPEQESRRGFRDLIDRAFRNIDSSPGSRDIIRRPGNFGDRSPIRVRTNSSNSSSSSGVTKSSSSSSSSRGTVSSGSRSSSRGSSGSSGGSSGRRSRGN